MKSKIILLAVFLLFVTGTGVLRSQTLSPILEQPPNLEENVSLTPEFDWDGIKGAIYYELTIYRVSDGTLVLNVFTVQSSYSDGGLYLDVNTEYTWKVLSFSFFGPMQWSDASIFTTAPGGNNRFANGSGIPRTFRLHQNYPNPFNPETKIKFDLPKESKVKLTIFDITGKSVEVLEDGVLNAGSHEVSWNAANRASGVYFYKIEAGTFVQMKKMIVVK